MILAFIPNPSLDKTVVVPGFVPGRVFRIPDVLRLAGGKGFNFARALKTMGGDSLVVGPLAGHNGRALLDLARAEGFRCDVCWIEGETRECLTVVDPQAGRVTNLYETGPELGPQGWASVEALVSRHLPDASWLAVCGSFPPGTPEGWLRTLAETAAASGVPALLDTHGAQLARAIDARPALVKINHHEASELLGHPVEGVAGAQAAAAEVQRRGARAAVITLGSLGAVGIDREGRTFGWAAPDVPSLSPVGSGDSLFAGLALGLSRGQSLKDALRLGIAAGAANTLRIGAAVFERERVEELLGEVKEMEGSDFRK